uniref:Dynein light intermediate chain n=1 Tax=Aceria tosichella TaxID=561515 RepID=A0A6G1SGQ2_9ACAR
MKSIDAEHTVPAEGGAGGGQIGEETKIWSTILQQVRQTDTKKLPANKSILVLGDNETGKTTLIARLAGLEAPKKGSGLEYNFIEIRDDYRDDSTKLGAWILDGDIGNTKLLNFALTETNFEHSCCLLVASMSQPWNIMRSLETWANVLEKHIESLQIKPASKLKQCRQKLMLRFLNYVAATDEADGKLVAGLNQATASEFSGGNQRTTSDQNDDDDIDVVNEATMSVRELGRDALSRNLGIDIIVVITKTDHIATLERDHDYTEETFDFIQQAIRKFCLQFGAALFYVSAKVNKNCDLLHKYLAHRIYDLPFKANASVVERDAIFVPSGWDNEKKISILYDNIRSVSPDDEYEDFIHEPTNTGPTQRDTEIMVENDQEFLLRMQGDLSKQVPPSIPNAPSPVQARSQNLSNTSMDTQPSGEGVLQNFFNSLLSKGRTMPLPPGAPEQ